MMSETIAVNWRDVRAWGCPYCGFRSSTSSMSGGGASCCTCGECSKGFVALGDGIEESPMTFGEDKLRLKLQDHPFVGTPAHGRPDIHPEYFSSRGVGMDTTPGCFVCGGGNNMRNNISGYVNCKASGERVVGMFKQGARLDYREFEPDYVQVKVGACKEHVHCLEALSEETYKCGGIISLAMIKKAVEDKTDDETSQRPKISH